uniref:Reverse transcriptase domain-containing protein n=1 Tax=Tanacetum cinerariifolium TaxID=118510 RepID=A0A6L2P6U8_TANCI|nr:reverse transcriptase domain-containing protein [Tanacetum cinerariifolium]
MEELCQPSINGRGRPIALIPIQATDFGLHHHMIQQVQNTYQFHGLPGDDANTHIDKFLEATQHMKQNEVSDDALRLSLFPYSLTHHATACYDRLPRNSIHTFDDMMRKFLLKYFPPSMVTKLRNEITKFRQDPNKSLFEAWDRYKLSIDRHRDTINAAAGGTFMQKTPEEGYELIENMTVHHNHWDTSATRDETSRNISSTTEIPEVVRQLEMINKNYLYMMRQIQSVKSVNTKCETCGGPYFFTECPTVGSYTQETTYATMVTTIRGVIPINRTRQSPSGSGALPSDIVANLRGDVKAITTRSGVSYDGPMILPTPSPLPKEVERETDVTKDKVQATTVLLRKLLEKLGDPGRFLIPCDFQGLESCMALADLGASINLMPLFVWKKLSLPDLTPTRMTLELATMSFAYPAGIAEDVFVQVGKFTFPDEFVVVNYDVDPHVSLILRQPFLRMACALVDVHEEELILRDDDEQFIFHADSTSKLPHKHGNESINMINFIDITCEDRFPEALKFKKSNHPSSGSTTPLFDSSPSLTPFETSDSLLEEFADELALLDPVSPGNEDNNIDFEADLREIFEIDSEKDKNMESKMKLLVVGENIVESNDLLPQLLTSDSTIPEESAESSENASWSSFPFEN